jgi:hypothetical protein
MPIFSEVEYDLLTIGEIHLGNGDEARSHDLLINNRKPRAVRD